jgi:hypothetical protein
VLVKVTGACGTDDECVDLRVAQQPEVVELAASATAQHSRAQQSTAAQRSAAQHSAQLDMSVSL